MLMAVLGIAGASSWLASRSSETAAAALQLSNGESTARPAVPVFAAAVEAKDMPLVVRGIGSVQAYNQAQLEQAEANKAKDQANLANAQRDLARYAAIVSNQLAVTRQQYDTQRATVQQLEATLESDQAQIDAAKLNVAYCAITHRSTASPASDSSMSATWYKRALPCRSSSSLKSSRST
jgi:hypothetical protein